VCLSRGCQLPAGGIGRRRPSTGRGGVGGGSEDWPRVPPGRPALRCVPSPPEVAASPTAEGTVADSVPVRHLLSEEAVVFRDGEVALDASLTGQPEPPVDAVRRQRQSPPFGVGPVVRCSLDGDRTGPAGAVPPAVERVCRPVVRRRAARPAVPRPRRTRLSRRGTRRSTYAHDTGRCHVSVASPDGTATRSDQARTRDRPRAASSTVRSRRRACATAPSRLDRPRRCRGHVELNCRCRPTAPVYRSARDHNSRPTPRKPRPRSAGRRSGRDS
jgi:hypothetical protein